MRARNRCVEAFAARVGRLDRDRAPANSRTRLESHRRRKHGTLKGRTGIAPGPPPRPGTPPRPPSMPAQEFGKKNNAVPSTLWWRGSSPSGARSSEGVRPIERFGGSIVKPRHVPCAWTRPKPEARGQPRGQARPPGAPLTSGTRGFCIRRSGGVIRGSPRGFHTRRGARARRPVHLVAAPRGRRIVTLGTKGGVEGVFPGRGSLSSPTISRPIR